MPPVFRSLKIGSGGGVYGGEVYLVLEKKYIAWVIRQ